MGTFREEGGTLFWGPYKLRGTIFGSPIFGNPHVALRLVSLSPKPLLSIVGFRSSFNSFNPRSIV